MRRIACIALLIGGLASVSRAEDGLKVEIVNAPDAWMRAAFAIPLLKSAPEGNAWDAVPVIDLKFLPDQRVADDKNAADVRCRAAYFGRTLYLKFEYDWREERAPTLKTKDRDGDVWADDGCEIHICAADSSATIHHFLFNLAGVQADERIAYLGPQSIKRDSKWNHDWKVVSRKADGKYLMEVAIPLGGIIPDDTSVFRLNLHRNRVGQVEAYSSPMRGKASCRPEYFGFAVLAGEKNAGQTRRLADRIVIDTATEVLIGEAAEITLQNPVMAALGQQEKLPLTLTLTAGNELAGQKTVAVESWPARLRISGVPAGSYPMSSLQLGEDKGNPLGLPCSWSPTRTFEAEDNRFCIPAGRTYTLDYPRTVGRKILGLAKGASLTLKATGRAAYMRLPLIFPSPGPHYGSSMAGRFRYKIDGRDWTNVNVATSRCEFALAEDLEHGEHTIVVENSGDNAVQIDSFTMAAEPRSCVLGSIVTDSYAELLTDVRVDCIKDGKTVRSECVRSPHTGLFEVWGLDPGDCTLRFIASGWKPLEVKALIPITGGECDLGVVALAGDDELLPEWQPSACYGRTLRVEPAQKQFTLRAHMAANVQKAFLVSPYVKRELKILKRDVPNFGQWNSIGDLTFELPENVPYDIYNLQLTMKQGRGEWGTTVAQSVLIDPPFPETFFYAGCGHMNTWGQQTSEYLARVAETAQLAGARMLLIANEVNPAYVAGALKNLRIPYCTTSGNHTVGRFEDFFGPKISVCDDGPVRIVTSGIYPYESWAEADALFSARPDATCRMLLAFEGYAPIELIKKHDLKVLFDGHSDDPHPALAEFPARTMHFRAPDQNSLRWIPLTKTGIAESIKSTKDLPVLPVPRNEPPPLRVNFSQANDGSARSQEVTIINDYDCEFPAARVRVLLAKGKYASDQKPVQTFDSDDGKITVLDLEVKVGAKQKAAIRIGAEK